MHHVCLLGECTILCHMSRNVSSKEYECVVHHVTVTWIMTALFNIRSQRPWIANHQKVDTFEGFKEMISQRLSQVSGKRMVSFNVCPPPPPPRIITLGSL